MRNTKFKNQVLIVSTAIVFLSFSVKTNFFEVAKQIEIYTTLFKELSIYYIDEINPSELTSKAIKNTLEELDPYTNYFDEQEVQEERIKREGMYSGFGMSVFYYQRGIVLNEIYEGYEADKKGLKAGDVIVKFKNQSLKNMDRDELSEILKVAPNTSVNLSVLRQGEIKYVTLLSEKIEINPVPFYDLIDQETGYIVLTRFNQKASSEVKKAFLKLKEKGMKNLIFDLRDNPGGFLGIAEQIADEFLENDKLILFTKNKSGAIEKSYATKKGDFETGDVFVLINENSASASEIVAGALQDNDKGTIVGRRSYGKGLVQRPKNLTYGSQLKVTISRYYTPSGRCIQALDYWNKDENGDPIRLDPKKYNAYKTKGGRTVYDGGGILPDIEIESAKFSPITTALLKENAIFNYATQYRYDNKIERWEDFSFTDKDFQGFLKYLKNTNFDFETQTELKFKQALREAEDDGLKKQIQSSFEGLMASIKGAKKKKITEKKEEIIALLKAEILKQYFYSSGLYAYQVINNPEIRAAVEVLNNESKYRKILK